MDDNNWLSDFEDDLVSYRTLFSTNLLDFSGLELSQRRRRDLRQRIFFFCAVTSLALLLPTALVILTAVHLRSKSDSPIALVSYALFALSVTGIGYVVWRGLSLCRAIRRSVHVHGPDQPPDSGPIDEESALLGPSALVCTYPPIMPPPPPLLALPPPPLPPPPPPPPRLMLVHPSTVKLPQPLSTTARPILAQPGSQAPPTGPTSGRRSPTEGDVAVKTSDVSLLLD